jgi:hypothetical protein
MTTSSSNNLNRASGRAAVVGGFLWVAGSHTVVLGGAVLDIGSLAQIVRVTGTMMLGVGALTFICGLVLAREFANSRMFDLGLIAFAVGVLTLPIYLIGAAAIWVGLLAATLSLRRRGLVSTRSFILTFGALILIPLSLTPSPRDMSLVLKVVLATLGSSLGWAFISIGTDLIRRDAGVTLPWNSGLGTDIGEGGA